MCTWQSSNHLGFNSCSIHMLSHIYYICIYILYLSPYLSMIIYDYLLLSIYRSLSIIINQSNYLSSYQSINLFINLFVNLSICLSICLSIYLSICLSIYLSIYLSTYLSTCVSNSYESYNNLKHMYNTNNFNMSPAKLNHVRNQNCMYVCMYVFMYVCMYVCMYIYIYIYIWLYMII